MFAWLVFIRPRWVVFTRPRWVPSTPHRGLVPVIALLSAGCPFVFGPPDLSNVDLDPSGGSGEPAEVGPAILSLGGHRLLDQAKFEISLPDDEEIIGGRLEMSSAEGERFSLVIPDEIEGWKPGSVSTFELPLPFLDCEEGYSSTWTAQIVDRAGRIGPMSSTTLSVTALGRFVESYYAHDAGYVTEPLVACVSFEGDPLSSDFDQQLQADLEGIQFRVLQVADYSISLGWPTSIDIDLYLYDTSSLPGTEIASSISYGPLWESVVVPLQPGIPYQLVPYFFSRNGAGLPYIVTALFRPEISP